MYVKMLKQTESEKTIVFCVRDSFIIGSIYLVGPVPQATHTKTHHRRRSGATTPAARFFVIILA